MLKPVFFVRIKNNLKKIILIIVVGFSFLIFCVALWNTFFYIPSDDITLPVSLKESFIQKDITNTTIKKNTVKQKTQEIYFLTYPKELRIPSIDLTARIQYVGITKKGNMATPNNFYDVGWFKYGTLPGEKGSAIIAGHVDNGIAMPAVFKNLNTLSYGDNIYIDTIGGESIHFVVRDMQTYDFDAPTEEIFNENDGKFLKLITCAGIWVDSYKTHNKRLVITAELI